MHLVGALVSRETPLFADCHAARGEPVEEDEGATVLARNAHGSNSHAPGVRDYERVLGPGSRVDDCACKYALNGVTGSGRRTSTADGPIVAESRCIVCSDVLVYSGILVLVVVDNRLPGRARKTLVDPYYKAVSCYTASVRITFNTCIR